MEEEKKVEEKKEEEKMEEEKKEEEKKEVEKMEEEKKEEIIMEEKKEIKNDKEKEKEMEKEKEPNNKNQDLPQISETQNKEKSDEVMTINAKETNSQNDDSKKENTEKNNDTNNCGWGEDTKLNNNANNTGWGEDTKPNNSVDNSGWGEDTKPNNSDNANPTKNDGGWGSESDANKDNNNQAWGDSGQNQNNGDWGNNTNSNENKNSNIDIQQMEVEDDKDIREDVGPLPEAKGAADTFILCEEEKKEENKMNWFNRDGRNNTGDPFIEKEMTRLLKEHEDFCSRKEDKTADMESIDFKAYFVKIYSNEEPIELKETKRPKIRFENMNKLPEELRKNLKLLKFDYLTPIQRMVMPYIQIGKDIVCVAETGSGKTMAYLFPIIGQMLITGVPANPFILKNGTNNSKDEEKQEEKKEEKKEENSKKPEFYKSKKAYPLSLILVPTRELAIQVSNESKKLAYNTGIRSVAVYGGEGKRIQILELDRGCDILVATPGRLIDLLEKNLIDLRMVKHLILDEADRMLDQNFYPDLRKILDNIPKRKFRQNLLFSATFDDEVKGLAKFCLNNYYFFKPILESPKQIRHEFLQVHNDDDKINSLKNFLKKDENKNKSILIFLRTKAGVDELGKILSDDGIKCCVIHGDKLQSDRNRSIRDFTSGKKNVLIATDLASRGLDFPKVYCVINFDLPQNTDDYIHRVGRSGRSGQEGKALTFIDGMDLNSRERLVNFLKHQNQEVPDWLNDLVTEKKFRFFGANKRKKDENNDDNNFNSDDNKGFKKPYNKRNHNDSNGDNNNFSSGKDWNSKKEKNNGGSWGNSNNDNNNNTGSWGNSNNDTNAGSWGSSNNDNSNNSWGNSNNDKKSNSWGNSNKDKSNNDKNANSWGNSNNDNNNNSWGNSNNENNNNSWGNSNTDNNNN
jgi:ATP-dependent RNA helicase DDX3X